MIDIVWNEHDAEIVRYGVFQCLVRYKKLFRGREFHVLTLDLEGCNSHLTGGV